MNALVKSAEHEQQGVVSVEQVDKEIAAVDASHLLTDQRRAYDIITSHFMGVEMGVEMPQLLMHIAGEGGTGKSMVIQTITDFFTARGAQNTLVKGMYTGITASLIRGSTLHMLMGLTHGCRTPRARVRCHMCEFWRGK